MTQNVKQFIVTNCMKQFEIDSYPVVLTAIEISGILKISKPAVYELMDRNAFH